MGDDDKVTKRVTKPWSNPHEQQLYFTKQRMLPLHKRDCPECYGMGKITEGIGADSKKMTTCRCKGTGRLVDNTVWLMRAVRISNDFK